MDKSQRSFRKPYVSAMFSQIASEYDRMTNIISFFIDSNWRKKIIKRLIGSNLVIDLCSGTGGLGTRLLSDRLYKGKVVFFDFNYDMLKVAKSRLKKLGLLDQAIIICGDVENLPFKKEVFDGAMMGFALRHIDDFFQFFKETKKVLKNRSIGYIMDIVHPEKLWVRCLSEFYFQKILPFVSEILSAKALVYQYIPISLYSLPKNEKLLRLIRASGFKKAGYKNLLGGIGAVFIMTKN